MSKKLIISLFIFSVFVPYIAHVSHIFVHSHGHDHTHHEHFQNGINEMEEDLPKIIELEFGKVDVETCSKLI